MCIFFHEYVEWLILFDIGSDEISEPYRQKMKKIFIYIKIDIV